MNYPVNLPLYHLNVLPVHCTQPSRSNTLSAKARPIKFIPVGLCQHHQPLVCIQLQQWPDWSQICVLKYTLYIIHAETLHIYARDIAHSRARNQKHDTNSLLSTFDLVFSFFSSSSFFFPPSLGCTFHILEDLHTTLEDL